MTALNVFEAILKMSLCTNDYKNILILQSSPVNPRLQLQVKSLIPSTQTPLFLHGLVRQSSISRKIYVYNLMQNENRCQQGRV